MKHNNIRLLLLTVAVCGWLTACKKESQSIFNMFDVTLDLHNDKSNSVSEYTEANPGDSLVIDFTINSPTKDMYMVCVLKVGSGTPFIKIPITEDGKRRSYSDVIKLTADKSGETSYRVWALDKEGVYLGDGHKQITIDVNTDYRHLPNRIVYFPDTVGKSMNCYLSLEKAESWSYTTGAAHAADIDLGIYRVNQYDGNGDLTGYKYYIYSLSANPIPFTPYDVSGWTKRTTLFSKGTGKATDFRDKLSSGLKIVTEAKKNSITLTSTEVKAGQYIFFLTPEGKYGALMINAITQDYKELPFMNVSIKIQS